MNKIEEEGDFEESETDPSIEELIDLAEEGIKKIDQALLLIKSQMKIAFTQELEMEHMRRRIGELERRLGILGP